MVLWLYDYYFPTFYLAHINPLEEFTLLSILRVYTTCGMSLPRAADR